MSEPWSAAKLDLPLVAPVASAAARFRAFDRWPVVADLNDRLGALVTPFRFIAVKPKRRRQANAPAYDELIVRHRQVPTRERNWHDFANALVWASFPKTKAALHAWQLDERIAHGARPNRSRASDLLTLFDEAGAVVETNRALVHPLELRSELVASGVRVTVFGHAVYEHVVRGVSETVAAALVIPPAADLDAELAARLASREPLNFGRVALGH